MSFSKSIQGLLQASYERKAQIRKRVIAPAGHRAGLKYRRSGGAWFFLTGISRPSALSI